MGFKGNDFISADRYNEAVKLYVEELVNKGEHSESAANILKWPDIDNLEDLSKFNQNAASEANYRFIGAQDAAWMIYWEKIKIENRSTVIRIKSLINKLDEVL